MEEPAYDSLPVILVSAKDSAAASQIIAEIIDNDGTESCKAEAGGVAEDRVWRVRNKYYAAALRLRARGDARPGDDDADAHLIYLQPDEGVAECARRCVRDGDVRLVLRARLADDVRAWARLHRYEPVALEHDDDDDDDEEEEAHGIARVREALQAHAWRGLVRTDRAPAARARTGSSSSSSSLEAAAEWVERAEAFALALSSLPAAALAARAEPARPLRLQRAEALLQEFCRALGDDLGGL